MCDFQFAVWRRATLAVGSLCASQNVSQLTTASVLALVAVAVVDAAVVVR